MLLQRLFVFFLSIVFVSIGSLSALAGEVGTRSQKQIDAIANQLMPPPKPAASESGEFTARSWGAPKEKSRGFSSAAPRDSSRRSRTYQADIKFHSGSAVLTKEGKRQLDYVMSAFNQVRERTRSYSNNKDDVRFNIGGHTDAYGDDASNQRLSERRAASVRSYIESKGYRGSLRARGYGENEPIIKSDPYDGRNRRVEVFAERFAAKN